MKKYSAGVLGLLLLVAAACETPLDERKLVDDFVVSTNYDETARFENFESFAIVLDTIGFASNASKDTVMIYDPKSNSATSMFPRVVTNAVRDNMVSCNYTLMESAEDADLGVNITVVNNYDLVQQVVYPNNYYNSYYGYSSYYYAPYVNTYAQNTGALVIELVDLKNKAPNGKVKVVWKAVMGDVYTTSNVLRQATDGILQAFEQSAYLKN